MELATKPKNEVIWDIVNNIYEKTGGLLSEEFIKLYYDPWVVNHALSNNIDTLIFAEVMNGSWHMNHYMQYVYLFYAVRKMRRYGKWNKRDKSFDDKVSLVKEYYGYSTLRAREIIPLIDKLDLWDHLRSELNKGGKGKHTRTRKGLNLDITK